MQKQERIQSKSRKQIRIGIQNGDQSTGKSLENA